MDPGHSQISNLPLIGDYAQFPVKQTLREMDPGYTNRSILPLIGDYSQFSVKQ